MNVILSTNQLSLDTNIKWEKKIICLTEQLGHCEKQSKYYYRELIKYQKLLYDAGS